MSLWEEKKNNFTYETVLKISVWQKKKKKIVYNGSWSCCTKHTLNRGKETTTGEGLYCAKQ